MIALQSAFRPALRRPNQIYQSLYQMRRDLAIAAARRNNASLWFAGAPADLAGFISQDSIGTTPATDTTPVGLMLDRSYGTNNLGPELREFGTTAKNGTVPSATYNPITGEGTTERVDVSNQSFVQFGQAVTGIGKVFLIDVENTGSSSLTVRTNGNVDYTLQAGLRQAVYINVSSALMVPLNVRGAVNFTVQSFVIHSVREVLGYHAIQTTTNNKPTLELQSNGFFGIRADGVNDYLETALAVNGAGKTFTLIASGTSSEPDASQADVMGAYSTLNSRCYLGKNVSTAEIGGGSGGLGYLQLGTGQSWLNQARVVSVVGSATSGVYVDGVLRASATGTFSGASVPMFLMCRNNNGTPSLYHEGLFALFCVAPTALPTADRVAIEQFAALLSGATYYADGVNPSVWNDAAFWNDSNTWSY